MIALAIAAFTTVVWALVGLLNPLVGMALFWIFLILGGNCLPFGLILLMAKAFQEDAGTGFCVVFFFPIYTIYYYFSSWDDSAAHNMIAGSIVSVGIAMGYITALRYRFPDVEFLN